MPCAAEAVVPSDNYLPFSYLKKLIRDSTLDEEMKTFLLRDASDKCQKEGHKEVYTIIQPTPILSKGQIYDFFEKISPSTIEGPCIGIDYVYANFRFFDRKQNYRILARRVTGDIELGLHKHKNEPFATDEVSEVARYLEEKITEIAPDTKFNDILSFNDRYSGYYSFIVIDRLNGNVRMQQKSATKRIEKFSGKQQNP